MNEPTNETLIADLQKQVRDLQAGAELSEQQMAVLSEGVSKIGIVLRRHSDIIATQQKEIEILHRAVQTIIGAQELGEISRAASTMGRRN